MSTLAFHLPLEPMLAAPVSVLPTGSALPGGCWYEPKFDGYRGLVFTYGNREGDRGVRVQSRRGADITRAFPDIAAAARELPAGTVLDGELLIWRAGGFDFGALQQRLAAGGNAGRLAERRPAGFIAFDVPGAAGTDLRHRPLHERRTNLERLLDGVGPPLQLSPYTTDTDQARGWLADYAHARVGVEGLVIKGRTSTYQPGRRGWLKYRLRDTAEVIVGAVTGAIDAPERLVLGFYDAGELVIAGATGPLNRRQREEVAPLLQPPAREHPWPTEIGSGRFGHWGGGPTAVTLVEPTLVVEVSADTAVERGRWRHLTRFVRARLDLTPEEVGPP